MSLSGKNTEIISELLTSNCAKVSTWMGENKFKLNATKTHFLTVGTSVRVDSLANPVEVVMDGIKLKEVAERSEKLLGVYIQYNSKWQRTLEELRKKLKKKISWFAKKCCSFPSVEDHHPRNFQQYTGLLPPSIWWL